MARPILCPIHIWELWWPIRAVERGPSRVAIPPPPHRQEQTPPELAGRAPAPSAAPSKAPSEASTPRPSSVAPTPQHRPRAQDAQGEPLPKRHSKAS
jgi:hypothetical protein